jgi:hypothetical protein
LESRREKLPGKASEIELCLARIRKDSERAASAEGAGEVNKEHVRLAISGLPSAEVVTESTEGSFAFVRVLVILGVIMIFVGASMELWFQNMEKYGEAPTEGEEIFVVRRMLWVGIILVGVSGVLFWRGRRESGEEWEEEEESDGEPEAPDETEGEEEDEDTS